MLFISSAQTSLLQLSVPVLNIDQIMRFLCVIMDVLDTSILIPEGNEASEQGQKVRKKKHLDKGLSLLEDFHENLIGFLVAVFRPAFITYGTYVGKFHHRIPVLPFLHKLSLL